MAAWTLADALVQLRREVDDLFPGRSKASDGTLGDTAHAARKSDHNPDAHGVVRAWDCTRDMVHGVDVAEFLAEWLRATRDRRVKYVIFRRRIFSSTIDAWRWRPYDGLNAHEHHCHVSVMPAPRGDDGRPWGIALPTTPEVDMPLTPDDVAKVVTGLLSHAITTGWQEDGTFNPAKPVTIPLSKVFAADRGGSLHAAAVADQLVGRMVGLEQAVNTLTELVQALQAPPVTPPAGG